jgi:hypothetical protein
MGYFGQQIYNEPMSMYVDPRLDILANSLGAVQKRHDDNYAQMSALDIMAHNTKVAEGDKSIKDAALGRLKTQRDAIAGSGDYAYAAPRIGMAVKDWSTDDTLIAAKENQAAIEEHDKQRQAMRAAGHIDLDFNPADNWSTIDPNTKQIKRFSSKLEKKLDWDSRAQEVTKLLENTENIGLSPANIRDYLQHGSITGITDKRVKDNLEGAIKRFMISPEGDQMKRSLTKIDGLTDADADTKISEFLMGVGRAQVHSKVNMDYQANTAALQREGWAREDARAAAELELKKKIAEGKLTKEGLAVPESPAQQLFNPAHTTIVPENLKGIMHQNPDGSFDIDASNNLLDFGKVPTALTPADKAFVTLHQSYRKALGDEDMTVDKAKEKRYELENKVEELNRSFKSGRVIFRDKTLADASHPKGFVQGAALSSSDKALVKKQLDEATKKLNDIRAIEAEAKKNDINLDDRERFNKINQDPASFLGKALKLGGTGKFKMYTNQPNKVNVDDKTYLRGEVTYTENELSNLLANVAQKGGKTYDDNRGIWTTNPLKDDWQEVFVEKGIIKPAGEDEKGRKLYSIPTQYQIQNTPSVRREINKNATSEGMLKEYAGAWEQTELQEDRRRELNTKYNPSIEARLNSIKDPLLKQKLAVFLVTMRDAGNEEGLYKAIHMRENELAKELATMKFD